MGRAARPTAAAMAGGGWRGSRENKQQGKCPPIASGWTRLSGKREQRTTLAAIE